MGPGSGSGSGWNLRGNLCGHLGGIPCGIRGGKTNRKSVEAIRGCTLWKQKKSAFYQRAAGAPRGNKMKILNPKPETRNPKPYKNTKKQIGKTD